MQHNMTDEQKQDRNKQFESLYKEVEELTKGHLSDLKGAKELFKAMFNSGVSYGWDKRAKEELKEKVKELPVHEMLERLKKTQFDKVLLRREDKPGEHEKGSNLLIYTKNGGTRLEPGWYFDPEKELRFCSDGSSVHFEKISHWYSL